MTILKKLSYLFLTTAFIFACEDTEVTPPPPPPCDNCPASQPFEAILDLQKISEFPIQYEPVILLDVSYQGTGTSNMGTRVSLEATHIQGIPDKTGNFKIEKGEFLLRDEDGDEMFGSHTGHGSQSFATFQFNWFFRIRGGTGKFSGAQGNMTMLVTNPNQGSGNSIEAIITGNIRLDNPTP